MTPEDEDALYDDGAGCGIAPDQCDHEDADIDILTGRMACRCGFSKWLSAEELAREMKLQAELYEEYNVEMEKGAAQGIQSPIEITDDQIPF